MAVCTVANALKDSSPPKGAIAGTDRDDLGIRRRPLDHCQGSNQVSPFFSVVTTMFAPSVGAVMDGEHAFATSGGTAWRRRQRRLRAFRRFVLWHSKMEVAAALHHTSRQRTATTAAATQTMSYPPDPADASYFATTLTASA